MEIRTSIGCLLIFGVLSASTLAHTEDTQLEPPSTNSLNLSESQLQDLELDNASTPTTTSLIKQADGGKNLTADPIADSDISNSDDSRSEPVTEIPPLSEVDLQPELISPSKLIKEFKDPRVPGYQLSKPTWGIGVGYAKKGTGTTGDLANKMFGLSFQLDYQPKFFQKYGVLGFGPGLGIYRPVAKKDNVTRSFFGFIGLGGQIRYQARFFREQPLVPYAGYKFEYYKYNLSNGQTGGLIEKGPFLGGLVLLNWFEPSAAAEAYVNYEISRTYLFVEYRSTSGGDSKVKVSGSTTYFGLRFEL